MHVGPDNLVGVGGGGGNHLGQHGGAHELQRGQLVGVLVAPGRQLPLHVLVRRKLDGHMGDTHHGREQPAATQRRLDGPVC